MSFKPLKHGQRFTYVLGYKYGADTQSRERFFGKYRFRVYGVFVDPVQALKGNWVYGEPLCIPETEGVVWVRGWHTKAANALRVACAL